MGHHGRRGGGFLKGLFGGGHHGNNQDYGYQNPQPAPQQPVQQSQTQGVFCPSCGTGNSPQAKFCQQCGNTMTLQTSSCHKCNKGIEASAKFCEHCGEKQ